MDNLEPPMISTLELPAMRVDLAAYTNSLKDGAHQQQVWVRHEPSNLQDSFSDVVHFFFDDTSLAANPYASIGTILRDGAEAEAVAALTRRMDALLDQVGTGVPDEAYVQAAGWPEVMGLASRLGVLLNRP